MGEAKPLARHWHIGPSRPTGHQKPFDMDESPISDANIDSDPLNLRKLVDVERSRATAPGPRYLEAIPSPGSSFGRGSSHNNRHTAVAGPKTPKRKKAKKEPKHPPQPPQLASAHQPHSVPSPVTPPDAVAMAGSLAQRRIDRGTSQIEMENIYKQYKHFFFVTVHEHRPRSTACKR